MRVRRPRSKRKRVLLPPSRAPCFCRPGRQGRIDLSMRVRRPRSKRKQVLLPSSRAPCFRHLGWQGRIPSMRVRRRRRRQSRIRLPFCNRAFDCALFAVLRHCTVRVRQSGGGPTARCLCTARPGAGVSAGSVARLLYLYAGLQAADRLRDLGDASERPRSRASLRSFCDGAKQEDSQGTRPLLVVGTGEFTTTREGSASARREARLALSR